MVARRATDRRAGGGGPSDAAASSDAVGASVPSGDAPTRAWAALEAVIDPEIPVLSVVELGIVREVEASGSAARVTVTPTYSGCPAMRVIERDIEAALHGAGFEHVELRTKLAPPWTTDWIAAPARQKLRAHGIAPPPGSADDVLVQLAAGRDAPPLPCPLCGSSDTALVSTFGPTACTSLHRCRACGHPFEHLKAF